MESKQKRIRTGIITIAILALLTILEYVISISMTGTIVYLSIIAVTKAGLILNYFMHVGQIRYKEGGH